MHTSCFTLHVDKYFSGWFPFSSRQLSLGHKGWNMEMTCACLENIIKSHKINHNIYKIHSYVTIPYLHMFQSLLQIQYCALTSAILHGGTLSACIIQHKDPYLKQLWWVSSTIPRCSANRGGIVGTATIFQSTALIEWQMTKQALICWAGVDLMYYCSQGRKKILVI